MKTIDNTQTAKWQSKVNSLLASEGRKIDEFGYLSSEEQAELSDALTWKLEEINNMHTRLLAIMGEVTQLPSNRLAWESNHLKITKAIQTMILKSGDMPSPTYIAGITGLSRQTVTKHLAEGDDATAYNEQLRNFGLMAPRVLNKVLQGALGSYSNMPAIKLYFELLEKMQGKTQSPQLNQQNNYIQINNTILKQETLQQLSPEQLKQIEEIVQRNMPKVEVERGE